MMSRSGSARGITAALVGLLLLVLTACSASPVTGGAERGVDTARDIPKATVEFENAAVPLDELNAPPPPAATRVVVPSLSIDMPIEPLGVDADNLMELPVSPFAAAWYRFGPAPASDSGATVIAAHVDSLAEGVGPFSQLRRAEIGASVTVVDAAGVEHEYRVVSVERIDKAEVPLDRVFTREGKPVVVLVTCGGDWNRQAESYRDNYIVTAEKVS